MPISLCNLAMKSNQVYVYMHKLAAQGLKVNNHVGQHLHNAGAALRKYRGSAALPGAPRCWRTDLKALHVVGKWCTLERYSRYESACSFQCTTGGPNRPIYASGDAGIYASQDGGKSFTLVHPAPL